MYKVGDRVKTIKEIQPHTPEGPVAVEGVIERILTDDVYVVLDAQTPKGKRAGWGTARVFKLADLLAYDVLRLRKGDKITTTAKKSNAGCLLTPGDIYVVEESDAGNLGAVRLVDNKYVSLPRATCTKVEDKQAKLAKEDKLGWSFLATKDTFDGARILRELDAAGADYAVVSWGKGEDDHRFVVHRRIADRLRSVGLGSSLYPYPAAEVGPGCGSAAYLSSKYKDSAYYCVNLDAKASVRDLEALITRLTKLEKERATFTTHVTYGKVK